MGRKKENILNTDSGSKVFIAILNNPGISGERIKEITGVSRHYEVIHNLKKGKIIKVETTRTRKITGGIGVRTLVCNVNFKALVDLIDKELLPEGIELTPDEGDELKAALEHESFRSVFTLSDMGTFMEDLRMIFNVVSNFTLGIKKTPMAKALTNPVLKRYLLSKASNGSQKRAAALLCDCLFGMPDGLLKKLAMVENPKQYADMSRLLFSLMDSV